MMTRKVSGGGECRGGYVRRGKKKTKAQRKGRKRGNKHTGYCSGRCGHVVAVVREWERRRGRGLV